MLAAAAVAAVLLTSAAGCARQHARETNVELHSTTQPIERGEPRGRHVELMVRDATSSGLSGLIVGKRCRVQFRRDAIGMSGATGVGPTQDYRGMTSIAGTVEAINDQWIIVREQNKRYVIPHGAILLIDVQE
jgi:hypothetical protein